MKREWNPDKTDKDVHTSLLHDISEQKSTTSPQDAIVKINN